MKALYAFLDEFKKEYENGTITISGNIIFSTFQRIRQTTHYILSKYMEPEAQEGRFRNIGNAIVDLEWRAKNIDRKNIEAHATDGDHIFSLVVTKELQQWMKTNNFGKTIDDYQRKKSEYGSVLLKKTETSDELKIEPAKWESMTVDPSDIGDGPKSEEHSLSLLALKKKADVWDEIDRETGRFAIDLAIEAAKKRKERNVKIYDIEGEFEYCDIYPDEGDNDSIALYNLIVAEVANKKYCLYKTELKKTRFKHDKRKEAEGRDFGVGVWEECTEPQIATNEAELDEREAMTLAGKVAIKTNKKNAPSGLTIRNGEVIDLEADEFFEPVSFMPAALPNFQQRIDAWFVNMQRDQSAFPGITGEQGKAGQPFSGQALEAAQAGSIFNKRRDQDSYFLLEVIEDWVLPFNIKQIDKEHTLTASYSPQELEKLDEAIADYRLKQKMLDGVLITPEMKQVELDKLRKEGQHRTFYVPKGYITLKRIKEKVRFDITDEMADDQQQINAIATTLQQLAPGDPARIPLIQQMMEIMGISAASYPLTAAAPTQAPAPKQAASKINAVLPQGQQV